MGKTRSYARRTHKSALNHGSLNLIPRMLIIEDAGSNAIYRHYVSGALLKLYAHILIWPTRQPSEVGSVTSPLL